MKPTFQENTNPLQRLSLAMKAVCMMLFLLIQPWKTEVVHASTTLGRQVVKETLVEKRWQLNQQFLTTRDALVVDYMKGLKECNRDDEYVFLPDGTYKVFTGSAKCSESAQELVGTGTWSLTENLELTVEFLGGKPLVRKIEEITSERISMQQGASDAQIMTWVYHNAAWTDKEILEESEESPYDYAKMVEEHLKLRLKEQAGFVMISLNDSDPAIKAEIRLARSQGKAIIGIETFEELNSEAEYNTPLKVDFNQALTTDCDMLIGGRLRGVSSIKLEDAQPEDSTRYKAIVDYEVAVSDQDRTLIIQMPIIASNLDEPRDNNKDSEIGKKLLKAGVVIVVTAATVYANLTYNKHFNLEEAWDEVSSITEQIDQLGMIDQEELKEELNEQGAIKQAIVRSGEDFTWELKQHITIPVHTAEIAKRKSGAIREVWLQTSTPGLFEKGDLLALSAPAPERSHWNQSKEDAPAPIQAIVKDCSPEKGMVLITVESGESQFTEAYQKQSHWLASIQ